MVPLLNPYLDLVGALRDLPREKQLEIRKRLIWAYSWAIPDAETIEEIARYSPILEIGAGTGYWAWLLAQAGARVTAVERDPAPTPRWVDLARDAAPAAWRDHALFLCWPSLDEPWASDALVRYAGDTVIYVGEWRGRTADAAFHERLESEWELTRELPIPRWPGFEDSLRIFTRRSFG